MKCENYNLWNDLPVNTVVEMLLVVLNLKWYLQGGKVMLMLGFKFFSHIMLKLSSLF